MSKKNIAITIAYKGTNYCGWQKQPNSKSIQGELEFACKKIFNIKSLDIIGSGRTDAGVHALGQVCNFKVDTNLPVNKIPEILNNSLPKDISVLYAQTVSKDFHSRFSVHKKKYIYKIYESRTRSPFLQDFSYQIKYELNFEKMKEEIKFLEGEHDFAGFMSSDSSVKSTVRKIYKADIYKKENIIVIEIEGNGFLYNMVRIIAGTLVDIGRDSIKDSLKDIINSKDRKKAGHTAPSQGLFLAEVDYGERYL